jgi:phosphoserine phosphatase RsbU/P
MPNLPAPRLRQFRTMPSLIVTSGELAGQVFSFADTAVVGRGQFSEVRLNHPTVSRRHALLRNTGDHYELSDQESANGTRHQGERISDGVRIEDGDEIEFGEVRTTFRAVTTDNPSLPGMRAVKLDTPDDAPKASATVDARATMAVSDTSGLREFLGRLKLFCDLGALARREESLREQLGHALDAVFTAFPLISRAAVYRKGASADVLTAIAQRKRSGVSDAFTQINAFLQEAQRMQNGIHVVDTTGRGALAERLRADALPRCVFGAPLRRGNDVLGVLYLDSENQNGWRSADQELLLGVAGLLAWMISAQQAQSPERAIEAHDLALARRIQQRFLPQSPPNLPGYRIADSYAAARVIGGDHYDFFTYKDGRTGIVIADVSGKSVSGALYMARLSVQVRTMARHLGGPAELLSGLNRKLYQELEAGMFVTMLAAVIDPDTGVIEFANAGHPAPLLRAPDASVAELSESGALPLGAMADTTFRELRATIVPGSCLLLYTDGLDEAHNDKEELFGKERIVETLRDCSSGNAQDALDALLAEVARFSAGEPQSDDLTLITLSRDRAR